MEMKWEQQTGRFSRGERLRVGKVFVGTAGWQTFTRVDETPYGCWCELPGIQSPKERYSTLEEAKKRLERCVRTWFRWATEEPASLPSDSKEG